MKPAKFGDEVELDGKVYIARPNLVQILTQESSCEGCAFDAEIGMCMSLKCGGDADPADRQFIYVLKEDHNHEA